MARILVVEDDELIRVSLRGILTLHGHAVTVAGDAGEARATLAEETVDLILLDVWLPGENGITLCREIRRRSDVPVLFLTASDDEACVVEGLNAGGDDYIAKPFRSMELLARIQAVLRRGNSRPRRLRAYVSGPLQLDLDTRDVLLHGKTLDLTQTESRILERLVTARGAGTQPRDADRRDLEDTGGGSGRQRALRSYQPTAWEACGRGRHRDPPRCRLPLASAGGRDL